MYENIMDTIGFVKDADPEVGGAMELELARQRRNLELIASENIVSPAVMAAMGTFFTNKYAEGYPGNRYYGGYCRKYRARQVETTFRCGTRKRPAPFGCKRKLCSVRGGFAARRHRFKHEP